MDRDSLLKRYHDLLAKRAPLQDEINSLPKGYLRAKTIKGKEYYYLQHREGCTVKSQYIHLESVGEIREKIKRRKELCIRAKAIKNQLNDLRVVLGIHQYRPVTRVDYTAYSLFISMIAHEYKRMGEKKFLSVFDTTKYRGLEKKYLKGFIDYISERPIIITRRSDDLILDPYTYAMYYTHGQTDVLDESLSKAIPAFLNQGLLITEVQEAVHVTPGK